MRGRVETCAINPGVFHANRGRCLRSQVSEERSRVLICEERYAMNDERECLCVDDVDDVDDDVDDV